MGKIGGVLWDFGHTLEDHTGVQWRPLEDMFIERLYGVLQSTKFQPLLERSRFQNNLRAMWDKAEEKARDTLREVRLRQLVLQANELPEPSEEQQAAVRIAVERVWRCKPALAVFPDSAQALQKIADSGLRQGVVSNTTLSEYALRYFLAMRGLMTYCDCVVSSADFGLRKPDPSIFRHAAGLLGLDPSEVVFVGDHVECDVKGARGVGMRAIWMRNGGGGDPGDAMPDAVCDTRMEAAETILSWRTDPRAPAGT